MYDMKLRRCMRLYDMLMPGYICQQLAVVPAFGLLFRGGAALYSLLPSLHLTDRKFGGG